MPTYEYECPRCARTFERFQSISEPALRTCPVCGAKVKRLIGAGAGLIFKGSGFHTTDYRSESYRKSAQKEKPSPPDKGPKKESASTKSTGQGNKSEAPST